MSILKVNTIQDKGGNTLLSSDGAGVISSGGAITNTPAFHVSLSADQSVATATETKIQFNNKILDTDNCYDNTTNYRFTPTTAGQYFIGGLLRFQSSATATQCFLMIKKNGSSLAQSYYTNQYYNGHGIHIITNMNGSTDYIEFFAHHNFGSNTNITSASSDAYGYGYRIIGA